MIYLLGIITLVVLVVAILSRWRWGVFIVFAWLLLEDLIRRFIPGQPPQTMLVKDILIALTFFSFLLYFFFRNKKIWKPPFWGILLIFVVLSIINVFNPNSPGLLFGLVGLRGYLWYLPLMFLGYYMFDSRERLLKFCQILVYLSIPLFLFTVFQHFFYDTGWTLVRSLADATQTHSFGSAIGQFEGKDIPLLPSVFGTSHRYSRFSMLLFFLGLGLLATKYPINSLFVRKNNKLLLASIFSSFLGIIISGVRSSFVLTSAGSILFFLFAVYVNNAKIRYLWKNNRAWIFSLKTMILLALPASFLFGYSIFFQLSSFSTALGQRISWSFKESYSALLNAKFFGYGTGSLSQGINYIAGSAEWLGRGLVRSEAGFGKVVFELGIAGTIIFYLFWIYLFYLMAKEVKSLKNLDLRNLGLGIFIFSFLILFWFTFVHSQVLGDATTLVILWFFVGVFFGLRKLATVNQ
ncbi:MAG: hypothetical protein AAB404_01950 [Patescibacteria group bacterium]|mgnify:CR=1 FL=1